MHLDEQAVDDVLQRVLLNVERTLSQEGHRAVLGIVTGSQDTPGVRVTGVTPDGPAHRAGLRSGDVILEVDGVPLGDASGHTALDRLLEFLAGATPGDRVAIHFARNRDDHFTDLVLGDAADLPRQVRSDAVAGPWADLELAAMSPGLGRYFGTERGLLVLRAPDEATVALQDGDVILRIGQRAPSSPAHAQQMLASYQAGEALRVRIMREGREMTLDGNGAPGRRDAGSVVKAPTDQTFIPPELFGLDDLSACVMRRL